MVINFQSEYASVAVECIRKDLKIERDWIQEGVTRVRIVFPDDSLIREARQWIAAAFNSGLINSGSVTPA